MAQPVFAFEACLGRGGFGEVYRARMTRSNQLQRTVAVKTLRADMATPEAIDRLRDEARLLAALHHPAILTVLDLVRIEGQVALIAEYVDGQDLSSILRPRRGGAERSGLPPRIALSIVAQVASALHAAWSRPAPGTGQPLNLIHRDIKPANIRISCEGAVKLLDFGIARSDALPRDARTATDMLAGTPGYLAPDRLTQRRTLPSADVYALGIVLYEALSGGRMFPRQGLPELTRMAVDADAHDAAIRERLDSLSGLDPELRALLDDMLRHDTAARASAAEVEHRAEELADRIGGPSLRRWTMARDWPDSATFESAGKEGPFSGRTIQAEGLKNTAPTVASPAAGTRADRSRMVVLGVAGVTSAALVVALSWLIFTSMGPGLDDRSAPEPGTAPTPSELADGSPAADPPGDPAGATTSAGNDAAPGVGAPPAGDPGPAGDAGPAGDQGPAGDPGPDAAEPSAASETPASAAPPPSRRPPKSARSAPSRAASDPPAATAPAAPSPLQITLSSFPVGAKVEVSGQVVCERTPCRVASPPGSFIAAFTLPDGQRAEKVIRVDSDSTTFGHQFAQ